MFSRKTNRLRSLVCIRQPAKDKSPRAINPLLSKLVGIFSFKFGRDSFREILGHSQDKPMIPLA